jgi:tellurite resistance protein TerA
MARETLSNDSLSEASRDRSEFSGHGEAKGAAGYRTEKILPVGDEERIDQTGQTGIINPLPEGFGRIAIGFSWDNIVDDLPVPEQIKRKLKGRDGIDLDLGCLYELQNGERGALQAFGGNHGNYDLAPFIVLSDDERTGDTHGVDEYLSINGHRWADIKRILIYVYIYKGVEDWNHVLPRVEVTLSGEPPLVVVPDVHQDELPICMIAGLENVRNGLKLTNYTEYYAGHTEMDRAFGFGLEWKDGTKGDNDE